MSLQFDPPILINVRDRVTHLMALVDWLEDAGHRRIVLIDNDSTYGPLLDYLDATPYEVVRLGRNLGSRAISRAGLIPDEFYVYTDPDLVPIKECPADAIARLLSLLRRHDGFQKAGLGLHLDDVPDDLPSLPWELGPEIRGTEVEPGAYRSLIDTTFALYRPAAQCDFPHPAIRTDYPYECRHMSWYVDEPDAEDRYYLERALVGPGGSSWAQTARRPTA